MFWFVGKVFASEDQVMPGTTAYSPDGEIRAVLDVYEGRIVEARCYDLDEGSVLVKWAGRPPMDWSQVTLAEACAHHLAKKGFEPLGMH